MEDGSFQEHGAEDYFKVVGDRCRGCKRMQNGKLS